MPKSVQLEVGEHLVTVTNPDKVYFPEPGYTKLDVVRYFLAVSEGALRGVRGRPMVLKRFVNGIDAEPFFQKRAPANLPGWIETARISFPSGRFADLVVCEEAADLAWVANLGCIDLNPWPVRAGDVDHPDELRVDLDPTPEATFADVRAVALVVGEVLDDLGYRGYPKTSGSRGIHINVRIAPRWDFTQVRRAALALAREVERRIPELATSAWWKEERHGVFIDYNQNARDRTVASAYSIRPLADGRVSCPLEWSEVADVDPAAFTLATVPARFRERGDPAASIDDMQYSLEPLLEVVARHEREGIGDAAWPPQFPKAPGEPPRVQPSRARRPKQAEAVTANATDATNAEVGTTEDGVVSPTGRRKSVHPLLTIAQAQHKADALAGLERWKARYPEAAAHLRPADVLTDSMRGASSTWTRIRVNLRNVPEAERPPAEPPDPDYNPWAGLDPSMRGRQTKRTNASDGRV